MSAASTLKAGATLSRLRAAMSAQLQGMNQRERVMVGVAAALVAGALLWVVLIAPAIRTLQSAPEQHASLDATLERMQRWAEQAEAIKSVPTGDVPARGKVLAAIQGSRSTLGEGSVVTVNGDRAVVQLGPTNAQAFARWLSQMRVNARVVPVEAQIRRVGRNWTGRIELAGPGLSGGGN
ncbi:type II secretion system protein GspM [Hydrogenophaga sp. 5NK40-0174]|uniref:type II secretion system protein GspM n=1 Tax=Hydrogenophaga sp. 5NK40-0174 TaxID=3127649 RepID=UPI0031035FDB